jgi:signal peptidase II
MKKWIFLIALVLVILGFDMYTKQWALENLHFAETTKLWGIVPITLTFNEGGGFSLTFGPYSRWVFTAIALFILLVLIYFYSKTPLDHWPRRLALSMISAGALGNLIDRIRWDHGVVDFVGPFDLGFMLWPIFNIADMAVSAGGLLLILSLWKNKPVQDPVSTSQMTSEISEENRPVV